jgi:hypothetical protein
MNWIQKIRECFASDAVFYTRHAKFGMENEEFGRILDHEVCETVYSGEVIEEYPEDKPYPSVLIFGRTMADRPLHIVCAYNKREDLAIIITVYHPNPELWTEYKRRRKP